MPTFTHLKSFPSVERALTTETLQENVIAFFNWGLLEAGGFTNVNVSSPGTDDPNADEQLYPLHQKGVADGTIWQAINTDWVYETGLEAAVQPVQPSGVYVDGTLYASNVSGAYAHHVNYPAGQVIFHSPIATDSVVQASYAWRWISFYDCEVQWFRQVVFDSLLLTTPAVDSNGDAVIKLLDSMQVQPPLVIIEPVMSSRLSGYELGSGVNWVDRDFLFHIITETSAEKNKIADIIINQKEKTFLLYDVNARRAAGQFALDWRGERIPSAQMYPGLVTSYPAQSAYFFNTVGQDITLRLPLFRGIVRATLRILV